MIDVLMAVAMLAVVAALVFPRLTRPKMIGSRISCVNNLKNIGLAFRTFAVDYEGSFPWATNGIVFDKEQHPIGNAASGDLFNIFCSVSNELSTPKIIRCPSDLSRQLATNTWSFFAANKLMADLVPSYFAGLTAREEEPQGILSGDRNLFVSRASEFDWRKVVANTPAWRWDGGNTNVTTSIEYDVNTIHKGAGNILMGDGSVQQVSSGRLRDAVHQAQIATNRLVWLMPVDH